VDSEEMLGTYVKAQRGRIDELAHRYAAVPVALLETLAAGPIQGASGKLGKWQRILGELHKQANQTPGNSVKVLETFIQTDMLTAPPAICHDKLLRASSEGGDYFLVRRTLLRDALRRRCAWLSIEQLVDAYDHLARRFNRDLAGRYPFSRDDREVKEWDAGSREIRAFLEELDAFTPSFDAYVAQRGREGLERATDVFGEPAIAFIGQARAVRRFFAPLLSESGPDAQVRYEVAVQLRVNRQKERFASQIIDWRFEIADRALPEAELRERTSGARRDLGDDTVGTWQQGDLLRVSLRWAKDAPLQPVAAAALGRSRVEDGTAIFEYSGPWSLIRLLRERRSPAADLEAGADALPHTLKFPVRLEKANAPPGVPFEITNGNASAFIRVLVTGPGGKVRITAPAEWPVNAPAVARPRREAVVVTGTLPASSNP
jgi:type VI secretion system protein ImpL